MEAKLSAMLGVPWTAPINVSMVYGFATSGYPKENTGRMIAEYVRYFLTVDSASKALQGELLHLSIHSFVSFIVFQHFSNTKSCQVKLHHSIAISSAFLLRAWKLRRCELLKGKYSLRILTILRFKVRPKVY